ncbi:MAG TPA: ankyrin repeat domain-containing protein [Gammaproteobacteria bacterium]|nr:ankyrin repeat domain-containing protein [Gammaproteobacteria bacterium]
MLRQALNVLPPKRVIPTDNDGNSTLHTLCLVGELQTIKSFLNTYPDVINTDWKNGGGTPLHLTLANENTALAIEVLREIIAIEKQRKKNILDLSIVDLEGKSLLILAAKARQWGFIRELFLHAGERTKSIIHLKDHAGKTALYYAALYGEVEIVKLLVEAGADIKTIDQQALNEQTVRDTLWSIEIHPDRSISAALNVIPASSRNPYDYTSIPNEVILQTKSMAQNCKKKSETDKLLVIIQSVEEILCNPGNYILATDGHLKILCNYTDVFCGEGYKKLLKQQSFSPKSVVTHCLEGHPLVIAYLNTLDKNKKLSANTAQPEEQKNSAFYSLPAQLFGYSKANQEIKPEAYTKLVKQAEAANVINTRTKVTKETALYAALSTEHFDRAKILMVEGHADPFLETLAGDSAAKLIERLQQAHPAEQTIADMASLLKELQPKQLLRMEN